MLWALVALVYNPYHLSFANGYPQLDWWGTVTVIILNVLLWQGIMKLWEKVGYAGSLEYWIGTIGSLIIPVKKAQKAAGRTNVTWYNIGKLDVARTFYDAEWVNLVTVDEIDHSIYKESRVVYKLALLGLILFPFEFFAWGMLKRVAADEPPNKFSQRAKIIIIVGIIFAAIWVVAGFIFTPNMLGIPL